MLPFFHTHFLVEHRVVGVDFLGLSCLASGLNLNLILDNVEDLRCQVVSVDDDNGPYPDNIPYQVPQAVNAFYCKS